MKIKVMMAQINTVSGDIEGNTQKILNGIDKALKENADIVAFPETAITGYCVGGLYNNREFVDNAIKSIDVIADYEAGELVIIFGNILKKGSTLNEFPILENAAYIIQNNELIGTYSKTLLANTGHHEDKKYFEPGNPKFNCLIHEVIIKGNYVKLGVPICEDIWNIEHIHDIVKEMKFNGADIILSINQSFFSYGKHKQRQTLVYNHVANNAIPMVYVNSVGVGDIVKNIMIFDGGSFAITPSKLITKNGSLARKKNQIIECKRFEEDFKIAELEIQKGTFSNTEERKYETISHDEKYQEIYDALIFSQKEVFRLLNLNAQVHISGGIDSALVGTLVAHAMGKDKTIFISNPTEFNSEKTLSLVEQLGRNLDINILYHEIGDTANKAYQEYCYTYGDEPSPIAYGSAQAIIRTAVAVMDSHKFKSGIIATGNHTEIVLGWATFHDIGSIGVHALVGDLTKVEIFQLSEWINEKYEREIIPKELYDGTVKPDAELGDNDGDPFDYYVVSGICALMIRDRKSPEEIINMFLTVKLPKDYFPDEKNVEYTRKHTKIIKTKDISIYDRISIEDFEKEVWKCFELSKRSVFKAAQGAPIIITSPRSRGFSNRETIFNFYNGK